MLNILKTIGLIACGLSVMISLPVLLSADLRKAIYSTVYRKVALIWPPEHVFVGDSLTADCNWQWRFTGNPLEVANLGVGGARIRDVAQGQIYWAKRLKAKVVFVSAGINDIIGDNAPPDQIAYDFEFLMRKIGAGPTVVVTLVPYTSDAAIAPAVSEANVAIRKIAQAHGASVVDMNEAWAAGETRRPEMTTDGVHLTPRAYALWIDALRSEAARIHARKE